MSLSGPVQHLEGPKLAKIAAFAKRRDEIGNAY